MASTCCTSARCSDDGNSRQHYVDRLWRRAEESQIADRDQRKRKRSNFPDPVAPPAPDLLVHTNQGASDSGTKSRSSPTLTGWSRCWQHGLR